MVYDFFHTGTYNFPNAVILWENFFFCKWYYHDYTAKQLQELTLNTDLCEDLISLYTFFFFFFLRTFYYSRTWASEGIFFSLNVDKNCRILWNCYWISRQINNQNLSKNIGLLDRQLLPQISSVKKISGLAFLIVMAMHKKIIIKYLVKFIILLTLFKQLIA